MLKLKNVSIQAGTFALNDFTLNVTQGDYFVLMGRTGSGKSLLLKAICGLVKVKTGQILIDEQDVTHAEPRLRNIGYVPQNSDLFPHLTVEQNLIFPLKIRGKSRKQALATIPRTVERLDIKHLLERSPIHLSGGERQKVALGRALLTNPKLLVLDEPVSALDETSRSEICELLKDVQEEFKLTTIHVCHNQNEADQLAHKSFRIDSE